MLKNLKHKKKSIEDVVTPIMTKLYAQSGQAPPGGEQGQGGQHQQEPNKDEL